MTCQSYITHQKNKGVFRVDDRLNTLWEKGEYPFDQPIIFLEDFIKVSDLLLCLRKIVDYLVENVHDKVIYFNHDWHEHDGCIMESIEISWNDYIKNLENEQNLYSSRDGDAHVRITIYSRTLEFVLRYYVLEEDEKDKYPGIWGKFDLTIDEKHLSNIIKLIEGVGVKYIVSKSKKFLDWGYGGRWGDDWYNPDDHFSP